MHAFNSFGERFTLQATAKLAHKEGKKKESEKKNASIQNGNEKSVTKRYESDEMKVSLVSVHVAVALRGTLLMMVRVERQRERNYYYCCSALIQHNKKLFTSFKDSPTKTF